MPYRMVIESKNTKKPCLGKFSNLKGMLQSLQQTEHKKLQTQHLLFVEAVALIITLS
jgi:hypothetical protein